MGKERRRFSKEFKAQVEIEALKEQKTLAQLSIEYGVHPNQISLWEKEFVGKVPGIFDAGHSKIDPLVVEDIRRPCMRKLEEIKSIKRFSKKSLFSPK